MVHTLFLSLFFSALTLFTKTPYIYSRSWLNSSTVGSVPCEGSAFCADPLRCQNSWYHLSPLILIPAAIKWWAPDTTTTEVPFIEWVICPHRVLLLLLHLCPLSMSKQHYTPGHNLEQLHSEAMFASVVYYFHCAWCLVSSIPYWAFRENIFPGFIL